MILDYDVFPDERNGCYQISTKTALYAIEFDDNIKEQIFIQLIEEIRKKNTISFQNLIKSLRKKNDEAKVIDVLNTMNEFQLLPIDYKKELSSNNDISKSKAELSEFPDLNELSIYVFSNGGIGHEIKKILLKKGFGTVAQIHFDEKTMVPNLVKEADFFIVDGCEWSPYHLEQLNIEAIAENVPWIYVGGIEETSFKIGPLFYGQETGCYNCLISRLKSNHEHPHFLTSYEEFLRTSKAASKPDKVTNSNLFENILANITVLEVMNFFQPWALPITWKSILSFDLINFDTSKHALLKKPFCEVCKPNLLYNPSPWLEEITLK